jgi:hypothetical protein
MRWCRDQKVEANLRSLGIQFEAMKVARDQIDTEEGIRRQARLINKLNEDQVLSMAIDMAKPDAAFPMPILQRPPHGKMWTWSGNHRLAAFDITYPDDKYIEAYVVTVKDPVMLDLLPRVVNAWESQIGFSKEERIANAKWMVDNHSMEIGEAARLFGCKPAWIGVANRAAEVKEAVADIPKSDGLPGYILTKLHPIAARNRNVLRNVVRLITANDIKKTDIQHIITDVQSKNTENQMMGEVGKWEALIEARKQPKKRAKGSVDMTRNVRDIFLRNLTGLAKVLDGKSTLTQLQLTDPADLAIAEKAWKQIQVGMNKVALSAQKV